MADGFSKRRSAKIATLLLSLMGFLFAGSGAAQAVGAIFGQVPAVPLTTSASLGTPTQPGAYRSMTPTRALDTRTSAPVGPDSTVELNVVDMAGLPVSGGAVVFNLTVTEPASFGFVSAYPSGTNRPLASNLNYSKGQTVANLVTVTVGGNGKVTLFNRSGGTVQLIADIEGYYLPGAPVVPGAFGSVAPARVLDTRNTGPVGGDSEVSFKVAGTNGVPADAAGVVFNLTVTETDSFGFVAAYPFGGARPTASSLNYSKGQTVPNLVSVPIGGDGKVTLFNRSSGKAQLIADVAGYYAAGVPSGTGTFVPVMPSRFLDTRLSAAVGSDTAVSFPVSGVQGIPSKVAAVVFNLTATEPKSFGFVTAYAGGPARPTASNLNFSAGQTIANLVTVPVGADGTVTLFNRSGASTQLIADVAGYFVAPEAAGPPVTATIPVGSQPQNIAVDTATHTVYVANKQDDTVSVINQGAVTATVNVGRQPSGLAVDPSTHNVYVANNWGNSITVINGTTVTDTIAVGISPTAVALDPETHTVYVTNSQSNTLSVIDGSQVTATIDVGRDPEGVAVDSASHTVYVTSNSDGTLSVIDGNAVTRTMALGIGLVWVAVDPSTHTVYVVNWSTEKLLTIKGTAVTQTIPYSMMPYGIAVDPLTHTIYIPHLYSDMVSVINGGTVTATIPTGSAPAGLAVDPGLGTLYVANAVSNTVSAISNL